MVQFYNMSPGLNSLGCRIYKSIGSALVQITACRLFGARHYLNQYLVIDNWTLWNKPQWNFNQNTKFFIHENASEYIVCEMAAILAREGDLKEDRRLSKGRVWSYIISSHPDNNTSDHDFSKCIRVKRISIIHAYILSQIYLNVWTMTYHGMILYDTGEICSEWLSFFHQYEWHYGQQNCIAADNKTAGIKA